MKILMGSLKIEIDWFTINLSALVKKNLCWKKIKIKNPTRDLRNICIHPIISYIKSLKIESGYIMSCVHFSEDLIMKTKMFWIKNTKNLGKQYMKV